MQDRRKYKRLAMDGQCVFRTIETSAGTGECRNVSIGGLLWTAPEVPPVMTQLWVAFRLAGRQFMVSGVVVRVINQECALVFSEEPPELRETVAALERDGRRAAQRVAIVAPVRVRRQSGEAEVVPIRNISKAGFFFESSRLYSVGEQVFVLLGYSDDSPDGATPEIPAAIVRGAALSNWGAFSYGVQFLRSGDS